MKEMEEVKTKNKKPLYIFMAIVLFVVIVLGVIFCIPKVKEKILGSGLKGDEKELYNTYIDYLTEYKNNEIADKDGEKQKTKYVYLRMIKLEGVEKPVMMVDALNEKYGVITDMYYIDKDGKVVQEKFVRYSIYGALYDFETKTYDYYLLQYSKDGLGYYDHIVNLSDYINKAENIREYDVKEFDPRFIGFELNEKVTIDGNPEKALTKAIKNMKTLEEFYKDEKEIIDDAHQEYKAMYEDDDEETIVDEKKTEEKPKTKCNSGFVYVNDDNRCYSSSHEKNQVNRCQSGEDEIDGAECGKSVTMDKCSSGDEAYQEINGKCYDKYTLHPKSIECPSGYEILFGNYGGQTFNGGCYKWEKPNY